MTKEEALETWLPVVEMAIVEADIPEAKEALEMAFKALEQWPCEDAISRSEAMKCVHGDFYEDVDAVVYSSCRRIAHLPPVTPAEPTIEIDGKRYRAEKPILKTIHKWGEVVISGFREVSKE